MLDAQTDRALLCRSVGWLIMDGEHVKIIAPHVASDEEAGAPFQGNGVMTIAARYVVRIADLTSASSAYPESGPVPLRQVS